MQKVHIQIGYLFFSIERAKVSRRRERTVNRRLHVFTGTIGAAINEFPVRTGATLLITCQPAYFIDLARGGCSCGSVQKRAMRRAGHRHRQDFCLTARRIDRSSFRREGSLQADLPVTYFKDASHLSFAPYGSRRHSSQTYALNPG